jgi:hypothetical protein
LRHKLSSLLILTTIFFLGTAHAAPPERQTIFVPAMNGFERYISVALHNEEVPVEVVTTGATADFSAQYTPASAFPGDAAIYHSKTGRYPEDIIEVVPADSRRILLRYRFYLMEDPGSRARAADEFARELKKKLAPKKIKLPAGNYNNHAR